MTPDTVDPAFPAARPSLVGAAGELGPAFATAGAELAIDPPPPRAGISPFPAIGAIDPGRALAAVDPERALAIRAVWRALWTSRLLVWLAGSGAMLAFGFGPVRNAFDPRGVTRGLGSLGGVLAAPAARWDAAWYLVIAHYGYRLDLGPYTSSRTAFFPLYPLALTAIAHLGVRPIAAGVLLSVVSLAVALYGIHRLTTLEFPGGNGVEVARLAVLVTAFAPMAFFFSAVYSESLYLALSVGVFLCARRGRWAWVGVLGALATATDSTGVVLVLPAAMLYLYGPREDRGPDLRPGESSPVGAGRGSQGAAPLHTARSRLWSRLSPRFAPRYRLRRDVLWLVLVPAGLGLYMAYLALNGGGALMPFHAQSVWGRHFAGPYVGMWDGLKAAVAGARQLGSLQRAHVYFPAAGGSPTIVAGHNLMLLAFLLAAVPMVVGMWRMLPRAYCVYVLAALALPLSYPVASQPLMSLPRFLVVLFPLSIWLGAWLAAHPRARVPVLVGSGVLMACFVAQFATWHWVA
jgi:Mannosyltransferase (PIG-V)